jgi:hypothetical protein
MAVTQYSKPSGLQVDFFLSHACETSGQAQKEM